MSGFVGKRQRDSSNRLVHVVLTLALAATACRGSRQATQSAPGQGVTAVAARDFLSSIGVNTHVDQGIDPATYVGPLQYAGIRNVRDTVTPPHTSATVKGLSLLHQQAGVLVAITTSGVGDLNSSLSAGQSLAAGGALLALEGPNEPNNFSFQYKGANCGKAPGVASWLGCAHYQRDLYARVKASAALKGYPVFASSEDGAETDNVGLQFLTIPADGGTLMPDGTRYADYANPHNYVCATNGVLGDNQAWNAADPTLNSTWDGLYGEYGVTWSGKFKGYSNAQLQTLPRVTTETGWETGTGTGYLSEQQQGKIILNVFLAQFKRGWRHTFIYQLRDNEGGNPTYGMFHSDSTPKPSATYLHNLTAILADDGPITPGALDYSIPGEPATVHDLLIQKSDGRFYLVVWDEHAPPTSGDSAATDAVSVKLGQLFSTVNLYDPTVGTSPVSTLGNVNSVPLTLTDHPLILELH
jgi:hypothetical protein